MNQSINVERIFKQESCDCATALAMKKKHKEEHHSFLFFVVVVVSAFTFNNKKRFTRPFTQADKQTHTQKKGFPHGSKQENIERDFIWGRQGKKKKKRKNKHTRYINGKTRFSR